MENFDGCNAQKQFEYWFQYNAGLNRHKNYSTINKGFILEIFLMDQNQYISTIFMIGIYWSRKYE